MSEEPQWISEKSETRRYDVENRTLKFAMACIDLCKLVKNDAVNGQLISELILSAGSRGANYREANDPIHKRDFYYRIGIPRRESKESKYWLEPLRRSNPEISDRAEERIDEALQLAEIFASISMA